MKQLFERKRAIYARMKELADIGPDKWDAEQRENWDAANADFDAVNAEIEQAKELESVNARMTSAAAELEQPRRDAPIDRNATPQRSGMPRTPGTDGEDLPPVSSRRRGATLRQQIAGLCLWVRATHDPDSLSDDEYDWAKRNGLRLRRGYFDVRLPDLNARSGLGMVSTGNGAGVVQKRDLGLVTPGAGQETVPEGFLYELERALLAFGGLRRVARILRTATGNPMPAPTVNDTGNMGEILAENTSIGASVDPTFAQIMLNAYKYSSKPILVGEELLEDSAFNLAAELGAMVGERIGRAQAEHFATGTGTGQPEGITNAATGKVAALNTAITGDELIDLQHSVDPAYRSDPSVAWVMNDASLAVVRKLKDGQGNYLWNPSFVTGAPDMLLGSPVAIDQAMPDIGASAKPMAYGPMVKYIIRDAAEFRFYRLNELYRGTDQTGFVAFQRSDGRLHDAGTSPIKVMELPA